MSRKRSSPLVVPTQMLPSRSSKNARTKSLERPSLCENRVVFPWFTYKSPWSSVPIHRAPLLSRSRRLGVKGRVSAGNGVHLLFVVGNLPQLTALR